MRAVLLIGINFVREQRWPILVLLLWVLLLTFLGLVTNIRKERDDLLFIFKQVAIYIIAFSIFFGGSAIYSERRSRRILAVLSKAIGRAQYLAGLVLGVAMACAIYCFSLGLTGSWTLGQVGIPVSQVWFFMVALVAACTLAGTVALMFSTFLNPFLAAGATAVVLGVPAVAGVLVPQSWVHSVPVYELAKLLVISSFQNPGETHWALVLLAFGETALFWLLAARIFSRVDVVVSVE